MAHELLVEVPNSSVALAIWADAAEAMMLDREQSDALCRLAEQVPFRSDVWLRLARVREELGDDSSVALERAVQAREPVEAADEARLLLADRDLACGDPARADRWLRQASLATQRSPELLARRVAVHLEQGEVERALKLGAEVGDPAVLDARGWLLRGRLWFAAGEPAAAHAFQRALLLDAPDAERVITAVVARTNDAVALSRYREILGGRAHEPTWKAAFATAEGRQDDALSALAEAARARKDAEGFRAYVDLAIELRNTAALSQALAIADENRLDVNDAVRALERALRSKTPSHALALLDGATGRVAGWAAEQRDEIYRSWCTPPSNWPALLAEISRLARDLGAFKALRGAETIAVDLERPVKVAIVGEFNAGKSSFINALLGEAVAPMGVLPTTASINRVVWAPDRFVRIEIADGEDRIVTHTALRAALDELDSSRVRRVLIYAPLEPLRRVELIDTPGFNAPDSAHASGAREAFREAHVALWLLDASQPLKESEREVLSEIRRLDVPLIVLLNKVDRLEPAQVQEALAHVETGLAEAGIPVEVEPFGFSAKQALEGRAGNEAVLEQSRWADVEKMFETKIVDQSERLRERVLRRRAKEVVDSLHEITERARARVEQRRETERRRSEALLAAVGRAVEKREDAETFIEQRLDRCLGDLDRDLAPVQGAEKDASEARFIATRARSVAGPALYRAILDWLELDELLTLEERLSALVAGAIFSLRQTSREESERGRRRFAMLVVDEAVAVAESSSAAPVRSEEEFVLGVRITSLARALGSPNTSPGA